MNIDPTQYRLHDGLLEAIDFNANTQTLTLSIELNLALAVTYDPNNTADDFRKTRLIFSGVSSMMPALPTINDGRIDPDTIYGSIHEFQWKTGTPPATALLAMINDDLNGTEDFIESTITYQTVEWQ